MASINELAQGKSTHTSIISALYCIPMMYAWHILDMVLSSVYLLLLSLAFMTVICLLELYELYYPAMALRLLAY